MKNRFRKLVCRMVSVLHPRNDGPVTCVAMVRNEIDIIDVWIAHLSALFDHVLIYDHASSDGTRQRLCELATRYPKMEVRHHDEPGHDQSGLMTKSLEEMAARHHRGWIFFLDADEFIMQKSRRAFLARLNRYRAAATVNLTWRNALPNAAFGNSDAGQGASVKPHTLVSGWTATPQPIRKAAINLRSASHVQKVEQGNHGVVFTHRVLLKKIDLFHVLHLPIRSEQQLLEKTKAGVKENAIIDTGEKYATHWKEFSELIAIPDLQRAAYNYGCIPKGQKTQTDVDPPAVAFSGSLSSLVPLDLAAPAPGAGR